MSYTLEQEGENIVKYKVLKGNYERFIRDTLALERSIFLKINWSKRTIHLLNNKGNKEIRPFWGM